MLFGSCLILQSQAQGFPVCHYLPGFAFKLMPVGECPLCHSLPGAVIQFLLAVFVH